MCVCTDPGVQDSVCGGLVSWTHYCWGGKRAVIRDEGLPPETEQETDCPVHTPNTHTHTEIQLTYYLLRTQTGLPF